MMRRSNQNRTRFQTAFSAKSNRRGTAYRYSRAAGAKLMLGRYAAGSLLIFVGLFPAAASTDNWLRIVCDYTIDTGAVQLPDRFTFNTTKLIAYDNDENQSPLKITGEIFKWGTDINNFTLQRGTLRLQNSLGFNAQCQLDQK